MTRHLSAARSRLAPRKPRRDRLQLETLEDRVVPATLVALTSREELLTIDSARPDRILHSARVTGLDRGEDLLAIDARPANGLLYGVTDRDQVYAINRFTGVATKVGGTLALELRGRRFGLDFNPTVDRIRLVSDVDQNLRLNPNDGTVVDGNANVAGIQGDTDLAYADGDPSEDFDPTIVASAYTNNFLGATTTTLYGLDSDRDTLVGQGGLGGNPSPNGGQLFTVGSLGIRIGRRAAFDIAADGTAYAAVATLNGLAFSQLATIDLNTGKATVVGTIGNGRVIDGLAVVLREEVVFAVTASNRLVSFRADDPGTLLRSLPISNLRRGETVDGIDFRPATGELFALTSTNRVLRLNPATGQAIQVGNPIDTALFASGQPVGIDFNPTVDRIRLDNAADDNLRYNPVTFTAVDGDGNPANGIQADGDLSYLAMGDLASGQNPNVVAVAYDRNDNDPTTPTTLFGIDSTRNTLVRQGAVDGNANGVGGSPNAGMLATIGPLGLNPTDLTSFDIAGNGSGGNGIALTVFQLEGESVSRLGTINLATGAATVVGIVGGGELIRAMAIAPPMFQFSAPTYSVREGGRAATVSVMRTGGSSGVASVQFSTSDGSAWAGVDYTAVTQTLTFADGETMKTVTIPILDDMAVGPNLTVNLTLSAPTGGNIILGDVATALLRITEDDRR